MTEAAIVRWLVAVGDSIAEGEPVAEVETDKVVMELESPATGLVEELLIEPGVTVEVNVPVATIRLGDALAGPSAEPPPQHPIVEHSSQAGETNPIHSITAVESAATATAPEPSMVVARASEPARSRQPFLDPPRVRFADKHSVVTGGPTTHDASPDGGSSGGGEHVTALPWTTTSQMSAVGIARALSEARNTRGRVAVTYSDLLVSMIARAAVYAFTDRTIIASVASPNSDSGLLEYRPVPGAVSLAPEALALERAKSEPKLALSLPPGGLHLIIVNGGRYGGDVVMPPAHTPLGAIVIGIGSIDTRVVALGGGVAVQPTVHMTVCAHLAQLNAHQVTQFVETIREKLSDK